MDERKNRQEKYTFFHEGEHLVKFKSDKTLLKRRREANLKLNHV